ncbi:MAG: response regulator [Williamsia sp.]|nr:response regulator [Williamsia sp.]
MMKALIIDDEPLARSIVKEYLSAYPAISVVQECGDGFEGVKAIMQHHPDLIFLDIQMPKINGFEMLELVDPVPAVIFTTAYDEYAIRAFETHAVDYLLKPFSRERFSRAIQKLQPEEGPQQQTAPLLETASQSPVQSQRIVVKLAGRIKIIPVQEVAYLEAADDFVKIHTAEGALLKNKTMSHFEQILDPQQFVRIHRSYILNIQQIGRLEQQEKDSYAAVLKSGLVLPVSKTGYTKLKAVLGI